MVSIESVDDSELKQRILQHARERFISEGFVSVSVDDLCSDLGISKKTFYRIFPSKDDLLHQEADWLMGEAHAFITGLLSSDRGFIEKAMTLSTAVATQASKVSRALFRDVQRHAPDIWKRIEEFRLKTLHTNFTKLIEQGRQEGFVRDDINIRVFMLAYAAAMGQIMTPAVLAVEAFSAIDAVHDIFAIFFQGILSEQGREQFVKSDLLHFSGNAQSTL